MKTENIKLIDDENEKEITVKRLNRKQMRVLSAKSGLKYDSEKEKVIIQNSEVFQDFMVELSTGLNKEEIDSLSSIDFARIFNLANKLNSVPKKSEDHFLEQS